MSSQQEDSSFFTRTSQSEGEYADGWSMDATPQTIRCESPVIYTSQMSNYEDMRECYNKYLKHGDKARYYDCVRQSIAKKIQGMDPDAGQAFIKSLGIEGDKDSIIRLCQQDRIKCRAAMGYGAAFAVTAGASLLVGWASGSSAPISGRSLIATATIGAAGILGVVIANHVSK